MYKLDQIRHIHLETTSKCQASCPMCVRNIQGGLENPWLKISEITLEKFQNWIPLDLIKNLEGVSMCGNSGDPIIAKDTLKIFEYIRSYNKNVFLSMNTNGSARTAEWWKKMASIGVRIIFGIDGLEDTHSLYRIGTDFNKIIENAKTFIEAGGNAEWHMLIFEHNEHQVNECNLLAESLKFRKFVPKNSSRFRMEFFPVLTKDGKTSHILRPSARSKSITKKITDLNLNDIPKINCKVKTKKEIFINAHGEVNPCCWMDYTSSPPMGFSFVDYNDKGLKVPNLNFATLKEIFDNGYFDQIEKLWLTDPLKTCVKECGKVDKSGEQFK